MKPAVPFLMLLTLCEALHAQPQWQVDSASVAFEITNAGLPVHGTFAGLEADVRFDPDDPAHSAILASVDASTVDAGIGLRNKHLRKRDYFYVNRYPRIRVESMHIEQAGADAYLGTFLLDVKGVQREVAVPFTFTSHDRNGRLSGTFTINRLDFGVGESSLILANDVTLSVILDVSRQDPR